MIKLQIPLSRQWSPRNPDLQTPPQSPYMSYEPSQLNNSEHAKMTVSVEHAVVGCDYSHKNKEYNSININNKNEENECSY